MSEWGQPVGDQVPGWEPREPAVAVALSGRYVELELWTFRPTEPPAVRAAHEQWLDGANFDADGRQVVALSGLTATDG